MPDGPINITTDILIAIREDISSFRTSVEGRLDRVEGRLEQLEQSSRKHQRDAAATLVIMRATVGHFNERAGAVEGRVTALEAPKS
jgi:hypothetical protein